MQTIKDYFSYAEVALASYASLIAGGNQTESIEMQAWRPRKRRNSILPGTVISQRGLLDGFNATLFQRIKFATLKFNLDGTDLKIPVIANERALRPAARQVTFGSKEDDAVKGSDRYRRACTAVRAPDTCYTRI